MNRRYRRRWQLAWWANLFVGVGVCAWCVGWPTSSTLLALIVMFLCGFLAAVLVEIATQ